MKATSWTPRKVQGISDPFLLPRRSVQEVAVESGSSGLEEAPRALTQHDATEGALTALTLAQRAHCKATTPCLVWLPPEHSSAPNTRPTWHN